MRGERKYFGSGTWRDTEYQNIVNIEISSGGDLSSYHLYERLDKITKEYVVSDNIEELI